MAIRDAEVDEFIKVILPDILGRLRVLEEVVLQATKEEPKKIVEVVEGDSGVFEYDVSPD